MRSMTGFGTGEARLWAGRVSAEVRSLNHRFLDLRVRLPAEIADQAFFVEQLCRDRLTRGRYDVSVRIDAGALPPIELDLARARAAYAALCRLRDEVAPGSELPLGVLAGFPTLLVAPSSADPEEVRGALEESLCAALDTLDEMRLREGRVLCAELVQRLAALRGILAELARHGPGLVLAQQRRLTQRLERLLGGHDAVDPARLAMEVAVLADRSDITEELVRLGSHFDQFDATLAEPGPHGRKLEFLLQEMGREANTIGAKCQDATLSHLVVALKTEIERLREQVQNME
jgi:uncharacterized protein (TIGR00255 family)